jgi:hypothetical protein
LDDCSFVAEATFEIDAGAAGQRLGRRRKFDFPEVEIRVAEGDAVDIAKGIFAEAADEADVGFPAGIGETHREDFIWSELVAGENAGTVEAEDKGVRFLGEDATGGVRSKEEDGDFFRDATASAHTRHIRPPMGP